MVKLHGIDNKTISLWKKLCKENSYLAEYVKNSLNIAARSKWVKQSEATELIGSKKTKLDQSRLNGTLHWRFAGKIICKLAIIYNSFILSIALSRAFGLT